MLSPSLLNPDQIVCLIAVAPALGLAFLFLAGRALVSRFLDEAA